MRVAAFSTGVGRPEIVTAPGAGGREVRLFDAPGGSVAALFSAFEPGFAGGAFASAASAAGPVLEGVGGTLRPFLPPSGAPDSVLVTLQLKPLDIDLLGLRLTTSPIAVTVSADRGSGKLLGNALSAAADLVNLQGVSQALNTVLAGAIDLANAGTLAVPGLTGGTLATAAGGGTTPILDLQVAPVRADLLGVRVETSPIRLTLAATAGDGLVLGNALTSLAGLFDPPLPDRLDLDGVNARLADLRAELEAQLPGFAALAGTSRAIAPPPGGREVLDLTVPPIDLNLLGLLLTTDQVAVNADAATGPGDLLGNVLTLLLDTAGATPGQVSALNANLNGILGKVIGVLNAAELTLPAGAVAALPGVLQTLARPDLVAAQPGALAPVLDLSIATPDPASPPVAVDLLGLVVTTGNVNLRLAARTGERAVLGNLVYNVAHLLDPNGSVGVVGVLNELSI